MPKTMPPARLPAAIRVGGGVRALFGYTLPLNTLALFFDAVAVLLRTGHSLPQALRRASLGADPEWRGICEAVAPALERGVSLTASLRPFAPRLPEIVLPLLEVGEKSGSLEAAARRLADTFHLAVTTQRRFRYGVFDPWLVIAALSLLSAARMAGMPLLDVAHTVLTNLLTLAACYLGGRLLARAAMRWPWLRLMVDTVKCALPHMGTVVRNLAAARWARSFATLWGAGVPVSEALEVSSRSALNAHYERALRRAAHQTRQGARLSQSLAGTQLLPAHLVSVIATGEASGNMAATLDGLAAVMEEEALARATQGMNLFVVAGEVLLALIAVAHS